MIVAALLAVGCDKQETGRTFEPSPSDDAAVIVAALRAFMDDPKVRTFGSGDGGRIALHHLTEEKDGMIGEGPLRAEFDADGLPADAIAHLRARHAGAVELQSLPLNEELIVWIDLDALPRGISGLSDFRSDHPDVRGWVRLWLPGYSADGRQAVLRFWFGPTPHGATATYVLQQDASGGWEVVDRRIAYYA